MTLITCKICGSTIKKISKSSHIKSKKHRQQWKIAQIGLGKCPVDVQKIILSYLPYFNGTGGNAELPSLTTTICKQISYYHWGINRNIYRLFLLPRYEVIHAIWFRELFELKMKIKDEMEILIDSYNCKFMELICIADLQKWCNIFTPNKIMSNFKNILFQQDINMF